jgi:hypothetical protein
VSERRNGTRGPYRARPEREIEIAASPETVWSHAHGRDHFLGRLALVAAGRDGGVDPWIAGPME